jgi:hypothetical protein
MTPNIYGLMDSGKDPSHFLNAKIASNGYAVTFSSKYKLVLRHHCNRQNVFDSTIARATPTASLD